MLLILTEKELLRKGRFLPMQQLFFYISLFILRACSDRRYGAGIQRGKRFARLRLFFIPYGAVENQEIHAGLIAVFLAQVAVDIKIAQGKTAKILCKYAHVPCSEVNSANAEATPGLPGQDFVQAVFA